MRRRNVLGVVVAALALVLAAPAVADITFARTTLSIEAGSGRHSFDVELARTPAQTRRGLMFRGELADDAGMLFDFGEPQPIAMWMKNTLIPLDMVFVGKDGTITRIAHWTTPLSLEPISSGGPVRAVLELKGGITERLGIVAGDRVVFPDPGQ